MTESRTSFFRQIQQEIENKKNAEKTNAILERDRRDRGIELYKVMRDMTTTYGRKEEVSVGAGSRTPKVMGHRLGLASKWVAPLVEIEIEEGKVNMQILEIAPQHIDDNRHHPLGFIIFMNGNILSSARPSGEVTNWLGENASSDQIDLIKNDVLPLMEEAYSKLPKPEPVSQTSPDITKMIDRSPRVSRMFPR